MHRKASRPSRGGRGQRGKAAADGGAADGLVAAPQPPLEGLCLVDLDALDCACPQRFYLPDSSFEKLADCFALVEGMRLPLHNQLLAARAAVLRQMFVAQAEEGGAGAGSTQEPVELSSAFSGCSLAQVATFLRLTYSPDHATAASLRAVHAHQEGLLAAVAGLAHRLDAAGLLAKIEAYLGERERARASAAASIPELLGSVQLAEACHLGGLGDTCLGLLATRLAAAGPFWGEQVSQGQLAKCSSDSLAWLACKMAGSVQAGAFAPPAVHGLRRGRRGAAGGYTWVVTHFSKQQGRITSPWVEEGLHYNVDCGKDMFTATTQNWGKTRMMPLSELNRSDRSYLAGDRLAVRVSIRVLPPSGGAAAAAIVQAPPAAVPGFA
ncbi:hypothetical protein CHLNCDRAFT_143844 [Chlorella variabilis]|uniref:BTB domain-containing protein n=1 Tax=Chlorella variabilis TaxID=554065 RepID=E1ZAK3_CHLVA|nr:hypothetical protein CHLNCDRAFT_143844 [Chlorella variabilis]EFN57079.1 hypothetical protein CHLNCDRAFT_143844 [Chlorella variabilis]|eukprot:XP_005849181.1 hypothetical protein CHLNCDRAFT_143844 [Chlorella variabilis]